MKFIYYDKWVDIYWDIEKEQGCYFLTRIVRGPIHKLDSDSPKSHNSYSETLDILQMYSPNRYMYSTSKRVPPEMIIGNPCPRKTDKLMIEDETFTLPMKVSLVKT